VIDDAELAAAIAQRPHWQLDDQGAVYAPPGAAAHVRVRPIRTPPRARERYAASVIKNETALQSITMPTAATAVVWSERRNLTVASDLRPRMIKTESGSSLVLHRVSSSGV
jgi:hypothetical protein